MDLVGWLLLLAIVCLFAFFVLQPDRFGTRRRNTDGSSSVSYDTTKDRDSDGDGDGGDGGGGDGGGGGD
jgi:hypothetical protein